MSLRHRTDIFSDVAAPWVTRFAPLIPAGEVLDLACGRGRHARLLAMQGHSVLAVDRDAEALATLNAAGSHTLQLDLESGMQDGPGWPLQAGRFSGIVVTNYLHRPLLAQLFSSLAPNGVLIYETFADGNQLYGKPSNPDFLLASGELLQSVRQACIDGLRVVAFEEGVVEHPKPAVVQRICVVRLASGLVPSLAPG